MKKLVLITLAFLLILPLFAQGEERILGVWFNSKKTAKIEITQVKDGSFAGALVWLKEPNTPDGKPKTDSKNPNPKLTSRPMLDMNILTGLVADGKGKYSGGKIYDPESGKTYSAKAELTDNNTLALRGFIGISLVGRTETWTRTKK